MSDDKEKLGQANAPDQAPEDGQEQGKAPERQTQLSLDQMAEEMFQKPVIKKLFVFTRVIGNYGHGKSIPDGMDGAQLVETIKECLVSYKKFSHFVELLLNGILQGKIKEEDVELTEDKLIEGIQHWIYFRIDMGFGKSGEKDEHLDETERALETLFVNDILGENHEEVILKLLNSSFPGETRSFIERFAEKYLKAGTKRSIQEQEEQARQDFEAQFRDPSTGKYSRTISPAGHTPPKGTPAQTDPQQSAPQEQQEKADITSVTVSVARWHQDEDYENRSLIRTSKNGQEVDPTVTPGRPLQMVDEEDVANVTATIEIVGNALMIIPKGTDPLIDLDSGLVVHSLALEEGKPARIQIDEDMFEILITGIERGAAPEPQEPPRAANDSHPDIEATETEVYSLPAVMCIDDNENVMSTYLCLDESDRVVRIGSHPSNDIVLPQSEKFMLFAAEVKFINGKMFVNSGKDAFIRIKNRPSNFFVSSRPVHIDPDDVIVIGGDDNHVYFRPTVEHPFSEADVKKSLTERLEKISALLAAADDIQAVKDLERQLNDYNKTLAVYESHFDTLGLVAASAALSDRAAKTREGLLEKERLENEAKMLTRRHFDADGGETAETPRPFKYAVLIDKIYKNPDGSKVLHPVFPPGVSMGKDKVNTLEAHLPRFERGSKYGVQDFECTFVLDGSNVRMVLEPRMLKNSKILVNGQIPGTRDGRTNELDMLRAPLKDGDDLEIGLDRFGFETDHEFTLKTIKPRALAYLREIMEVFVLYPDHGDEGDKKNARATLAHFLTSGIVTQAEVDEQQALFEEEKLARETTGMTGEILTAIREQNQDLARYVEGESGLIGLPYDAAKFRAALELLEEPAVRWDETGWTQDEYRRELKDSATIRLHAYDKKLLDIRAKLQQGNYGARAVALFSKNADQEYKQEQESLLRAFRKMLVEMVSLIQLGVMSDNYESHWLSTRLSSDQDEQAEEIVFAQRVVGQIHDGADFSCREVRQVLETAKGKTYGDYFNYLEAPFETPMADFVRAKIKARAKVLLSEAGEGDNISANIGRLEELVAAGLVTYEALQSSPEQFQEFRDLEEYFAKQKAGHAALAVLMSAQEPSLEDIVDFAERLRKDEFTLSDEKDEEFKKYCRAALETAIQKARVGEMTSYFAVLVSSAVRLKLAKLRDVGTTMEELNELHEKDEASAALKEMTEMVEEIDASGSHNIHLLLKLKNHVASHEPGSLVHEGKSGETILQELVEKRMENIIGEVLQGRDPEFLKMIVDDMRQFGLEPAIKKCLEKGLQEAVEALYEETQAVAEVRPFIETLRLLGMDELVMEVGTQVVNEHLGKSFDDPSPEIGKRIEKLGEDLRELGLN